jgi:hypothetical protein
MDFQKRHWSVVMDFLLDVLPEMIATIVGVAIGGMGALYNSRRQDNDRKRKRANILLQNLAGELSDNMQVLKLALSSFNETSYGRSFHLGTIAWDTATAKGDLADILGIELADRIENQYRVFFRLRYYIDLMTRLWLAPMEIEGRADIREGFKGHIVQAIEEAIEGYPSVQMGIDEQKTAIRKRYSMAFESSD